MGSPVLDAMHEPSVKESVDEEDDADGPGGGSLGHNANSVHALDDYKEEKLGPVPAGSSEMRRRSQHSISGSGVNAGSSSSSSSSVSSSSSSSGGGGSGGAGGGGSRSSTTTATATTAASSSSSSSSSSAAGNHFNVRGHRPGGGRPISPASAPAWQSAIDTDHEGSLPGAPMGGF